MTKVPLRFNVQEAGYKEAALAAFQETGAVILTNVTPAAPDEACPPATTDEKAADPWQTVAKKIPSLLFDTNELLLGNRHQAAGVHLEHDGFSGLEGKALPPHSDGYVWGDAFPDIVILLCEQPAPGHGESYLLHGEGVVQRLDPDTLQLLKTVPVDHTERNDDGVMAGGVESIVPIFRWQSASASADDVPSSWLEKEGQRLCWRRMVHLDYIVGKKPVEEDSYISLWKPVDEENAANRTSAEEMKEALLTLDQAIVKEDQEAERFQLQAGEALIVDNYRLLHAREAYCGDKENAATVENNDENGRRMWRVWSWTTASHGLPPHMNTDSDAPATAKDVEKLLVGLNVVKVAE
jgi:alpha-ketoglutarate-dependent taurine dioxygenase